MSHDFETLVIHAGIEPEATSGAVMTPIYQTSTFVQKGPGDHLGYEYARTDNPTRTVLQTQLAILERAENSLVFSSGMSAIDAVMNLLEAGDHVIAGDDLYGGTRRHFTRVATHRGIQFSFCTLSNRAEIESLIQPNTKLIWLETPTNPMLRLIDIAMVGEVGKKAGILTAVDNTFMSPYFQRPLEHGVDIVMHSMTKYLNGHSDVVMGALMVNEPTGKGFAFAEGMSMYQRLKFIQNSVGAVPGPFDCWLVLRGIKTLAVRMQRIGENAMEIASWLEQHPKVERVIYPGLASHASHDLAKRQTFGFGGMITMLIKGGEAEARRFLESCKLFSVAESLGGVESLIEHPAIMTHASVPADVRADLGITDNLIRLSVGIESARDLKADLETAFAAMG